MAAGDTKSNTYSIASGATQNIIPDAGQEWIVRNLYFEAGVSLLQSDGSRAVQFDTQPNLGWIAGCDIHITTTRFLAIKNDQIIATEVGFDGVQSK